MLQRIKSLLSRKTEDSARLPCNPPPLPITPPLQSPQTAASSFHANQDLVPENELERMLARCKMGEATDEEVLNCFLNGDVKVLDTEFDKNYPNKLHSPFLQRGPANEPLLALFTSSERATPHRNRHPDFKYLKTIKAYNILSKLHPQIGIVLNPGWKIGLQLSPDEVQEILEDTKIINK